MACSPAWNVRPSAVVSTHTSPMLWSFPHNPALSHLLRVFLILGSGGAGLRRQGRKSLRNLPLAPRGAETLRGNEGRHGVARSSSVQTMGRLKRYVLDLSPVGLMVPRSLVLNGSFPLLWGSLTKPGDLGGMRRPSRLREKGVSLRPELTSRHLTNHHLPE